MDTMKKEVGLWIDHRKAVIVILSEAGEEIKQVTSHMEKHVKFSGGDGSEEGSSEDVRDRKFGNHLNSYYAKVVALIRDAEAIQIFGPGEAKDELRKLLEHEGLQASLMAVESMDKMTDRQIAAKVRERFRS